MVFWNPNCAKRWALEESGFHEEGRTEGGQWSEYLFEKRPIGNLRSVTRALLDICRYIHAGEKKVEVQGWVDGTSLWMTDDRRELEPDS